MHAYQLWTSCHRYFGDSIDITDVFEDYENLVSSSSSHS